MNVESFRLKDPLEWTVGEVGDFLASILPGQPCLDYFRHTSGYVLCSLEKEDLRKQTKNDEATNVIWMELASRRKGASPVRAAGGNKALVQRGGLDPRSTLTLYVKAPRQGAALELEMLPLDTIAFLKAQIEVHEGTPPDSQRLVFRGSTMQDDRSLTSYGLQHGDSVLLIPTLRDKVAQRRAVFAPRGLLSLPGSKAWSPSSRSPFLPVLFSDVSRNFPISMEFSAVADCEAFAEAARYAPPWLEILPGGPGRLPADVKCRFVYRDLKPENILLHASGHVMLTDFDLSFGKGVTSPRVEVMAQQKRKGKKGETNVASFQVIAEPQGRANSFVGTEEYLAPEVINAAGHGSEVDWWSFGILIHELLYGYTPFRGSHRDATFSNILRKPLQFPEKPEVSLACKNLISQLLIRDPTKRLGGRAGAEEIKAHPFFETINWSLIRNEPAPFAPKPEPGRQGPTVPEF